MINENAQFTPLPGSEQVPASTKKSQVRRVIGIDPGLANTGFGVVDFCNGRYRMVSYGCITTGSEEPHGQRLLTIYNRLCAVFIDLDLKLHDASLSSRIPSRLSSVTLQDTV